MARRIEMNSVSSSIRFRSFWVGLYAILLSILSIYTSFASDMRPGVCWIAAGMLLTATRKALKKPAHDVVGTAMLFLAPLLPISIGICVLALGLIIFVGFFSEDR